MHTLMRTLALAAACLATAQAATAATTGTTDLHRQPNLSGAVLRVLPSGTLLTVACQGDWCRTTYQGRGGYVARALTRPLVASAPLSGRGTRFYRSCAAMRLAGVAPLRIGQPGFRTALDRNGNGLDCEQGE
ncbi:excalibur calcium-binding domain-containing protein [Deinococcus sp.]|uniref:excalibur calcium-binding domain-containing protein n=1 Tax=Deinococcus sp. TaxID=47478 RepID=UPI003C7A65D4